MRDENQTVLRQSIAHSPMKLLLALLGVGAMAAVAPTEEKKPEIRVNNCRCEGWANRNINSEEDAKFCIQGTEEMLFCPCEPHFVA
eukprot:IDg11394t1